MDFFWDPSLTQGPETQALSARVWPRYLVEESDLPVPGFKIEISRAEFERRFPAWGLRRSSDRKLVAFASGVLLRLSAAEQATLPNRGWRFAIERGLSGEEPNALCLVLANVDPEVRGAGLAGMLIDRSKRAARELGFETMIAPVRPTLKHLEPNLAMREYVEKRNSEGAMLDPWLRAHQESGAEFAGVCDESVRIVASLERWRDWTKGELNPLPGALAPLRIDRVKNTGLYVEPNVWMRYRLS